MNETAIKHLKLVDNRLSRIIDVIGNINIHVYDDPFRFLVGEIVGQMISNNVRRIIITRLNALCYGKIEPQIIMQLSIDEIRQTGMSVSKAKYIYNLARLIREGEIDLPSLVDMDDASVVKELVKIKGIGSWTAKMYLLFYLQRPDILPYEDGAFLQAYKWLYNARKTKPETIIRKCRSWKPYSSYASRYLYAALDGGLTKHNINDFLSINNE